MIFIRCRTLIGHAPSLQILFSSSLYTDNKTFIYKQINRTCICILVRGESISESKFFFLKKKEKEKEKKRKITQSIRRIIGKKERKKEKTKPGLIKYTHLISKSGVGEKDAPPSRQQKKKGAVTLTPSRTQKIWFFPKRYTFYTCSLLSS